MNVIFQFFLEVKLHPACFTGQVSLKVVFEVDLTFKLTFTHGTVERCLAHLDVYLVQYFTRKSFATCLARSFVFVFPIVKFRFEITVFFRRTSVFTHHLMNTPSPVGLKHFVASFARGVSHQAKGLMSVKVPLMFEILFATGLAFVVCRGLVAQVLFHLFL